MGSMKDLLGDQPPPWVTGTYPASPGFTNQTTSKAAAALIEPRAGTLRRRCLDAYREAASMGRGLTADEVAFKIGESVLAVRPRITELAKTGWLVSSGETRQNDSGVAAQVMIFVAVSR